MICEVHLLDVPYHIDKPYDYFCGEEAAVGSIVSVPFGRANHLRLGVVTKLKDRAEEKNIKSVHSVRPDRFALSGEMLGLCFFLKEYTLCTLGEAVRTVLPPGAFKENLNIKIGKKCTLKSSKETVEQMLSAKGKEGIRSEGQRRILQFLLNVGTVDMELIRDMPTYNPSQIKALSERGLITVSEYEAVRNPYASYSERPEKEEIALTEAQSTAYSAIEELYSADEARCALLFGVTGSGKTKVIMKAIDKALADRKSVIMLVPEISLTPQTVSIFCRRYGERVAVIHSSLSEGERLDAYKRIRNGEVDLVIGTRSAIFAPLENIGMIVIDEEHEHTYKSESSPKYHARDVAAYRCGVSGALLLLASATPSLESFYKAECGMYTLVPLRERYKGIKLPTAVIVDMREELRLGNTSPISDRLLNSLMKVYEDERQAIIFLNRRGYSSQINCRGCGEVMCCPRCSVSLTHHTSPRGAKLMCHLCGYEAPMPRSCPSCGSEKLSFLGFGTQKLEGELNKYLPDMRTMRMDADTTAGKLSYDRMLDDFRAGEADILLGTQMVAKGHDFPRVSLVGVALADTSLYVSDFRAAERTFSLLTQVIGRAGRAESGGLAVIQTFTPQNETVRLACAQDYERFYRGEIAIRRELSYPPFCDMVQITMVSDNEDSLARFSERVSEEIVELLHKKYSPLPVVLFGPFEAQVYKMNDKYRKRMILKCKLNRDMRAFLKEIIFAFSTERDVTLSVDINPLTV